ncbi:MAG: hypothetical protein ACTS4U_01405 [Candidatus Hodgkinia cicadicola]
MRKMKRCARGLFEFTFDNVLEALQAKEVVCEVYTSKANYLNKWIDSSEVTSLAEHAAKVNWEDLHCFRLSDRGTKCKCRK